MSQSIFCYFALIGLLEFNLTTAKLLSFAALWGTQFEAPTFDNEFVVESSKLVGNDRHAQLLLRPLDEVSGEVGAPIPAISFGDDRTFKSGQEVHSVLELSVNRYQGNESMQMILRHLAARKVSEPA